MAIDCGGQAEIYLSSTIVLIDHHHWPPSTMYHQPSTIISIDSTIKSHDPPAIVISRHQELSPTSSNYDPPAFPTMTHSWRHLFSSTMAICRWSTKIISQGQPSSAIISYQQLSWLIIDHHNTSFTILNPHLCFCNHHSLSSRAIIANCLTGDWIIAGRDALSQLSSTAKNDPQWWITITICNSCINQSSIIVINHHLLSLTITDSHARSLVVIHPSHVSVSSTVNNHHQLSWLIMN